MNFKKWRRVKQEIAESNKLRQIQKSRISDVPEEKLKVEHPPITDEQKAVLHETKMMAAELFKDEKCMCCGSKVKNHIVRIKPARYYPFERSKLTNHQKLCEPCIKQIGPMRFCDFRTKEQRRRAANAKISELKKTVQIKLAQKKAERAEKENKTTSKWQAYDDMVKKRKADYISNANGT